MLVMPGRATSHKARIAANLPIEQQIQAENLLLDLEAQPDSEGIKVIVPGNELFSSNRYAVQDAAHARLAQVAELLQLYKQQQVLVLGHTDAAGYGLTASVKRGDRRLVLVINGMQNVNQRSRGGRWVSLGFFDLNPATAGVTVRNDGANGRIIADAVRFVRMT